jgi:hypothetical protein
LTIGSAMFAIVLFRQAWQTFLGKEEEEMTGHE